MLTDGGSVAITTLPSLPVFCTTGAEAGTDPVLVMVRSPPVLSPPVSEIVRSDEPRSEEHTSELQSLMRISYAVFCLKKTKLKHKSQTINQVTHAPLSHIA